MNGDAQMKGGHAPTRGGGWLRAAACALALMIGFEAAPAEAQWSRTLEMSASRALGDVLGPPLGVLVAVGAGVGGLYAVGWGLDFAVRQGNGGPLWFGAVELALSAMHLGLGSLMTWAGATDDDPALMGIGIPAVVFGAYYLVHGIYSLADPGEARSAAPRPPPDPFAAQSAGLRPAVTVDVLPTAYEGGGGVIVVGAF